MDAKQKSQSRCDRRRKKQTKQQKDDEHVNNINQALNTFLKAQNITPEVYNEHAVYTTTIQVNCFLIESRDQCTHFFLIHFFLHHLRFERILF